MQFAALGVVVMAPRCWRGARSARCVDGLAAAACLLVLLQLEAEHFKVARQLFNENLYMPLVMASLIVLVSAGAAPRARHLVAGGCWPACCSG